MAGASSTTIWIAEEGQIKVAPVGKTAGDYTGQVTDLSISGGERAVEAVKTFGGNSFIYDQPQDPFEISLTLIKQDTDLARAFLGGTDITSPISLTGASSRSQWSIMCSYSDGVTAGERLRLGFKNAYAFNKELSSAADGYLEETISFKCKAADYREAYTADASASALGTFTF